MAYTTPDRTWVPGEVATAAFFNTYLRDNMKWLSTDKPMARATNTATQNILVSGSVTAVTFNTNTFDNASMHSTSSLTERFVVPSGAAGKYISGGYVSWTASALGSYRASFAQANASVNLATALAPVGAGHNGQSSCCGIASYTAGQYMNLACAQDSGGALATQTDHNAWAIWVGF